MPSARFLQIHSLHAYSGALLNRDDAGLAKRLPFGGAMRTRVSSQCLKRHWRMADDTYALHAIPGALEAIRSRETVTRKVIGPLRDHYPDDVLGAIEAEFQKAVYGEKGGERASRQPLLLGFPEVEFLHGEARRIAEAHASDAKAAATAAATFAKEARATMKAMREQTALPGGLTAALFGRMVTSDPEANIDAPVHVAHALTVHAEESESDYFSVVDDLRGPHDEAGADHIGDAELTSGLFYGYVVVDVPGLVSNLTGDDPADWRSADREMAAKVVEHLIHLIATVSPGAKLGSTAPYGYALATLVESGDRQPRSLANAFRKPCEPQIEAAMSALSAHVAALDANYATGEARRLMALGEYAVPGARRVPLPDLAGWAAEAVRVGEAS